MLSVFLVRPLSCASYARKKPDQVRGERGTNARLGCSLWAIATGASMIRSFLIGLTAGARAMTPLAAVANAARTGRLPADNGAPAFLAHPWVSLGTMGLAVYELVGDKQRSAPDRIIPPAVVIRSLNAAFAGAAVAPRDRRLAAAAVAGATAALVSWISWKARMKSMERHSQALTGFIEDAIVGPATIAAAAAGTRRTAQVPQPGAGSSSTNPAGWWKSGASPGGCASAQ
jgi:uncharacterized membrane protein